ncbi:MAG: ROK family protein [Nevskiaceae bacterium]|jgi:polyphosphate glucokinase|nr:ROK family protein [Nevskiaceae bacterium]
MNSVGRSALGIDVGGSSIKHGLVDDAGGLLTPLEAAPTPRPASPESLVGAIATLPVVTAAPESSPLGVALPSVIRGGIVHTAANLDHTLIGAPVSALLSAATGRQVVCLNDADAAGLAEVHYGAAAGVGGVVMVLTFGTGIGSGLFSEGRLVPNTELGHLQMSGVYADARASARIRTAEGLDWPAWAQRVNDYLALIDSLFWPELIVIGGGVVENYAHFSPHLRARAALRPARFGAAAGVVGAALAALQVAA